MNTYKPIGATYLGENKTEFRVFAPHIPQITLHILTPQPQNLLLVPQSRGYHQVIAKNVAPGATYRLGFNGKKLPDPASRFQPEGVFGASQVVDPYFAWRDQDWQGLPLTQYIIYECHVGTFTAAGTFAEIISRLDDLCELGITAIELMPIAQFSGDRNWGYDGVFPFAPQNSYGTPQQLKELINACHQHGLAVILDVVYNHLGPEGNVLGQFGPYFTDRHQTPWGSAINFDGPYSDAVRYFFLENALMWLRDYHIDALRLDALHAIYDSSAYHFAMELTDHINQLAQQLQRPLYLIAESALNDTKIIRSHAVGGYGLDAQWNDDFQHALHALMTQEKQGYYQDFGNYEQLVKAIREGFVLTGQYSEYWQHRHGAHSRDTAGEKFVIFAQNHDQIGNRAYGERLTQLVNFEQLKLMAGLVLLSPFVPLLFMGEEYGETAPFLYFTSHSDPELIANVWKGRKADIHHLFGHSETPNPQEKTSFTLSKLNRRLRNKIPNQILYRFYQVLIRLRKSHPAFYKLSKAYYHVESSPKQQLLFLQRWDDDHAEVRILFNCSAEKQLVANPLSSGKWRKILDSTDEQWADMSSTSMSSQRDLSLRWGESIDSPKKRDSSVDWNDKTGPDIEANDSLVLELLPYSVALFTSMRAE